MSNLNKLISFSNLKLYDELIKKFILSKIFKSGKNIVIDESANTINAIGYVYNEKIIENTEVGYSGKTKSFIANDNEFTFNGTTIKSNADGIASFIEGIGNTANGIASHSEGLSNTSNGDVSHTEGYFTKADGYSSHAEGNNTISSGIASHAEGCYSIASGNASHAEGYATQAKGECSHVEGSYTIANGDNQHVSGKWNIASDLYVNIVGNGNSETGVRSNAYTLNWDGTGWFGKDVVCSGESESKSVHKLSEKIDKKDVERATNEEIKALFTL
jgi:hypothetical protein